MFFRYRSMIICDLLTQSEPLAQQDTSPHIRSTATIYTPRLPSLGKSRLVLHSVSAQGADVWPASCSISSDHLDPTVLAEAGNQIVLAGEPVPFLDRNYSLYCPHSEYEVFPPEALDHDQVEAVLGQASKDLWGHLHLGGRQPCDQL